VALCPSTEAHAPEHRRLHTWPHVLFMFVETGSSKAMRVPVSLTLPDVVRYQYFGSWRRLWPLVFIFAAAIPLFLFGFFALLLGWLPGDLLQTGALYLGLAFVAAYILAAPYLGARKLYRQQAYLREPMTFDFTREGIHLGGASFSSDIAWRIVHEVRETRTLWLVYHTPQTAWILPKRFLSSTELEEWRRFVREHLPEESRQWKAGERVGRFF
jgi:YcxB-like protein